MINRKYINYYKSKIRANKVKYSTADGLYKTTQYVKFPFNIPEISDRKVITHCFHVDNTRGDSGIGYDTIVGLDLMLRLGMKD